MENNKCNCSHFNILRIIGMVILGLITAVVFGFLFGYFVQMLWNWLMPPIFGLKAITFWQAFGLIVLAKLIFGSFGHHHDIHKHHKWHKYHHSDEWEIKGGWKNWSYYDDWWKSQGRKTFEKYIEEQQKSEEGKEG
jgi:uncharacterized membrane protein YraQ (UPF0718 family)